ncbi:MAG: translation initiation factor IF-2 [Hyphomicrobium sp.]
MMDTKDTTDKTSRPAGGTKTSAAGTRKPLSLQRTVESGLVRQNFSHGRSKSVVVEKRKSRKLGSSEKETSPSPVIPSPPEVVARPAEKPAPIIEAPPQGREGGLLQKEREARAKALAEARRLNEIADAEKDVASSQTAGSDAKEEQTRSVFAGVSPPIELKEPAKAKLKKAIGTASVEQPQVSARQHESGISAKSSRPSVRSQPSGFGGSFMPRDGGRPKEIVIPEGRTIRGQERQPLEVSKSKEARGDVRTRDLSEMGDEEETRTIKRGGKLIRTPVRTAPEPQRERVKLTINNVFDQEQRERSLASLKRKRERERLKALGVQQPREKIVREVIIPEAITIQELSNRMAERAVDLIKFLMKQGAMHKITDVIDADTAELIAQEFGHTVKRVSEADVETGFIGDKDNDENLRSRAPVVTIMGHVDHGKTSLLDAIRQSNVVSGEAGGITQHIGAYQVSLPSGDKITFIDTPGHAAFTAMRARGAKVTDIVVLVVAADDGVMPQTVEAINHAKSAGVPLIVAINKIDKPQADPNRVKTDLLSHEVVVESMGGDTLEIPVSAIKKTNLDKLLEAIHLQAEILDLKANPERTAEGVVIEAKLERGRGPVGTVLVQRGTLHVGDIVVAGTAWGRVRALIDDKGQNALEAGPSVPVEVLGFDSAPEAGDQIAVVETEARARELTDYRMRKRRETLGAAGSKSTLEQMMQQLKETGKKDLNLVIKGDVQGSGEAIAGALKKLGTDEVEARILHSGVGGITESDIVLAAASKAVVVGFNVRANAQAKQAADVSGIEIRYYNIIYDLLDDVKAAMSGLLAPTIREIFLGNAEVLQVFNISKVGKVAGCRVTEGKVQRGGKVRLIRDNVVIHEGTLSVLRRFKDDVKEVPVGQECGMSFANYQDLREGDVIECFNVESLTRTL